jgi:TrmH family RNA methyltransferase
LNLIQSKDNPIISEIKKLKEKKYRTLENKFIVEGFRFVSEALQSKFQVSILVVSENQRSRYEKFKIEELLQSDTKVYYIKEGIFNTLCSTDTPQGILAVVTNKQAELTYVNGFYVLVDGIQDPGNLGTLIRTADAAGALGVILLKGTVDVFNEKTLRATMGSIFHLPVVEFKHLEELKTLMTFGFRLIVSSLQGEKNFYDENLLGKIIIAVGNEGNGVSDVICDLADSKVKIPMPGNAESLNVAIAGSIMMFEYVRQNS